MKQILILSCLVLLAGACTKHHPSCCVLPKVEMVRVQTQCADAWGYDSTNLETSKKLNTYLLVKEIIPDKILVQPTGEQTFCAACTCSRSVAFHVWVDSKYVTAMKAEGFSIKQ